MIKFVIMTEVIEIDACFGDTFTLKDKHIYDFLVEEFLELVSLSFPVYKGLHVVIGFHLLLNVHREL